MDLAREASQSIFGVDVTDGPFASIGSFYAFILDRSKRVRLTVVARSNYEAVKKDVGHNALEL